MLKEKEVQVSLTKKENEAISFAMSGVIASPKEKEKAIEIRLMLQKRFKSLVSERKEITAPIKEGLKKLEAKFKPHEEKLEEAIEVLTKALTVYQTEETRKADEAKDKIADRADRGTLTQKTALKKMGEVAVPEKQTKTDVGGTTFVETPLFEVEDVSKLPKEYILPNESLIRKAMLAGTKLEGVRYWTEQRPRSF